MREAVLLLFVLARQSLAVIYNLNESEYNHMPPLYGLDDFSSCMLEPGAEYCLVDVDLYGSSDLMRMIQEYSAHIVKHFNHTQIHRGVCVTNTCKGFIQNREIDRTEDLRWVLEECVNDSLWKQYELEGKVAQVNYCQKKDDTTVIDLSDIIVAVVYLVIIFLNIVGSFYDVMFCSDIKEKSGNQYLLAFSVRRNWKKLLAPSGGEDPRIERLKVFHGLRTMTMVCVFFSHIVLLMVYTFVDNPLYIEKSYEKPLQQILFNGTLVTYTFFVMSAFLLTYIFMLNTEKKPISLMLWPKGILLRWLRLTPTYALVLATISTWMRHLGSGPLWGRVVVSEADACRQYWWAHVLYINNYVYKDALCMPQTWYLAADTQLFCVGLLVCCAARTPRARKAALLVLFVVSLLIPAAHTYFQNLDAVVIQSPEAARTLYRSDATFRQIYIRGHTNLSTYTLGLAGGFLTYHLQKTGVDINKYKKYRVIFWLLFPSAVLVILSGGWFYSDGAPVSTALRVLYATFYKPVFQLMVVAFIIGCVFKLENVYRRIVEWRAFTWTGRVSYGGFLLHTVFQRGLIGSMTKPLHITDYFVMVTLSATIFLSFLSAAILWVLVEAPAANITKAVFTSKRKDDEKV